MWYLCQLQLPYKIPQTRWFELQILSHISGTWESEIRVLAWLGCGEGSLPGLQTAGCLLTVLTWQREGSGVSSSSFKGTNPILGLHPHELI